MFSFLIQFSFFVSKEKLCLIKEAYCSLVFSFKFLSNFLRCSNQSMLCSR